ncbi:uncharacterized protein LOC121680966 [Alosa sapidissima]|uniref:uncharacterized protein LOC121680966 n=1 Tax=Alosa sapidissima TaxID=34773 RepID=UPI001C091F1B|nr:uncharacterized protein LOC121680966 [Alosa sapidissima]
MSVSSTSKICLIAVALVLIACNVVCIAWFLVSKAQSSIHPTKEYMYVLKLSPESMPSVLGNISSKAHCFLKVSKDDSYTAQLGPVKWDQESNPRGMSLDANGKDIIVNDGGYYIVFAQAVFMGGNYTGEGSSLRLQLDTNDDTGHQFAVVWDEREVKHEQMLRLSFLVLVELRGKQYIRVQARHRNSFIYNTPISTFLTVIRYANLQDATNGKSVHI